MNSGQATLYYGIFVSAIELCIAAEAYTRIKPQLDFFKLLRLRMSKDTLSFSATVGVMNVSKIPQDVWEMFKVELIRDGSKEAEIALSNEAVTELREGTLLDFFGRDEPFEWSPEMVTGEYEWEQLIKRLVASWVLSKKLKVLL
ncbi:hypothetical protein JCM5353_005547 [Sporobolomyces roseus]